jgi:hypothetical protein
MTIRGGKETTMGSAQDKEFSGYIYVFSHKDFPGIFHIGVSTLYVDVALLQLNQRFSPQSPFKTEAYFYTKNTQNARSWLQETLKKFRFKAPLRHKDLPFFQINFNLLLCLLTQEYGSAEFIRTPADPQKHKLEKEVCFYDIPPLKLPEEPKELKELKAWKTGVSKVSSAEGSAAEARKNKWLSWFFLSFSFFFCLLFSWIYPKGGLTLFAILVPMGLFYVLVLKPFLK